MARTRAGRAPAEMPRAAPVAAGDAGRGASGRAGLNADRSTPMDGSITCGVNLRLLSSSTYLHRAPSAAAAAGQQLHRTALRAQLCACPRSFVRGDVSS
jgi:hypothetical protein